MESDGPDQNRIESGGIELNGNEYDRLKSNGIFLPEEFNTRRGENFNKHVASFPSLGTAMRRTSYRGNCKTRREKIKYASKEEKFIDGEIQHPDGRNLMCKK